MTPVPALPYSRIWFVFNELSAQTLANGRVEGHRRMDDVVDAVAIVMNGRPAELVSIGENALWGAELASRYTVAQWCASADHERKNLLLQIATKTEFPDEAGEALKDRFYLSEFFHEGLASAEQADARGLGAAFLLDGIAVSLPSEDRWKVTRVRLHHVWLDEGGTECSRPVEVLNLPGCELAEPVYDAMLKKSQHGLKREPSALAARRAECFPHLRFGRDVGRHIRRLPTGVLALLVEKLIVLDDASRMWRRDPRMTVPRLPSCRPESEPTMQKYGDRRVFRDAAGVRRTYELHCSVASYRIHLRVMSASRCLEIGYIGKHLPTKKHP